MKLNKAGIEFIAKMFDEFEEHVNKVARAVQGTNISIDMDSSDFDCYPVSLHWKTWWRDEVDDYGFVKVNEEDFLNTDYEATREKHAKLREEKKRREKEEAEAKKAKAKIKYEAKREEAKAKIIEDEKVMLEYLRKKYPELTK